MWWRIKASPLWYKNIWQGPLYLPEKFSLNYHITLEVCTLSRVTLTSPNVSVSCANDTLLVSTESTDDTGASDLIHCTRADPYFYMQFLRSGPGKFKHAWSIYVQQKYLLTPISHLLAAIAFGRADYNTRGSICQQTCKVCKSDEESGYQTQIFIGQ